MSDGKEVTVKVGNDYTWLMIVLLVLFCAGEPDLIDALVHYVMQCGVKP